MTTTGAPNSSEPTTASFADQIRLGSIGDRVYDTLLSQLIALKIAPGSRIAIDKLVREFGVSQTPIREALIRLEIEGLVEKTHNVGYSAAPMPSRHRFEEMFDMRLLLEPYLAGRAAQRISDELRVELAKMAAAMAGPPGEDKKLAYGKFAMLDANFHSWIAAHGNNELAADALHRLYAHTHLFRLRFHAHVTDSAIKEHSEIVQALSDGNSSAALDAMASHIMKSRERVAPFFEAMG